MLLPELNLARSYRTNVNNMVLDFYNPVLSIAVSYKRAVGYFTISSLINAAQGLEKIIENNGVLKIVASPVLNQNDIETIQLGYRMKEDVYLDALIRECSDIESEDEKQKMNYIATLIADNRLDIKIAVMDNYATYHEKFGIVEDKKGNRILFMGSMNETDRGMNQNFESFVIFRSWNEMQNEYVEDYEKNFNDLWNNNTSNLEVLDFPKALRERLLQYRTYSKNEPYEYKDENKDSIKEEYDYPKMPEWFQPREYQNEAIEKWKANNYRGILTMATGTGKTLTGLYGFTNLWNSTKRLVTIIVCPYQHLVEQWAEDVFQFNVHPILCYSSHHLWRKKVFDNISLFNSNTINNFTIITTNSTFVLDDMQNFINSIKGDIFILEDEVHNAGTNSMKSVLDDRFKYRLGLSATPRRYRDDASTDFIFNYFGGEVFSFDLQQAIAEGYLTRYFYYPKVIELTAEEQEEYDELSLKIAHNIKEEKGKIILNDIAEKLLIKRARIVAGAQNKLDLLRNLMNDYKDKYNVLVYCGATNVQKEDEEGTERQIDKVCKILGIEYGMTIRRFTAEESSEERQEIINMFTEKSLQAIVAIKCLDEGVNIPAIQFAFILSSTTDPKEFIQRRGRVLRNFPGKDYAYIYDFITVPYGDNVLKGKSLVETELKRTYEFASLSENFEDNMCFIEQIANEYQIDLDKIKDVKEEYVLRGVEIE